MSGPYRTEPDHCPTAPARRRGRPVLNALLWMVCVIGAAVNLVTNIAKGGSLTVVG